MRFRCYVQVAFRKGCRKLNGRATFRESDLVVIGLHTVFEHHEAQGSVAALQAFLHEYRVNFPVGIDAQDADGPLTMRAYGMRGTPTTLLYDRAGALCMNQFGHIDDMRLGAAIMMAIAVAKTPAPPDVDRDGVCKLDGCS